MLAVLFKFSTDPVSARSDSNLYALIFFIIGIISFFTTTGQTAIFSIVGEGITKDIRKQTF
jgi:hypothetical protein